MAGLNSGSASCWPAQSGLLPSLRLRPLPTAWWCWGLGETHAWKSLSLFWEHRKCSADIPGRGRGLKGCGTEWRVIGGARRHRTRTRVRRPEEERRASTGDTEKRMKAGLMQGEMTMRVIITGIYGAPTACQAHAKNLMSVLLHNSDHNPV